MRGNVYIDGVDARAEWGVWIPRGGYDGLFGFPSLKEPDSNDWKERDGLECDLSSPKLSPLSLEIDFVASGGRRDTVGFLTALSRPGVREMEFPSLGRTFALRLSSGVDFRRHSVLDALRLGFVMDRPQDVDMYVWADPQVRLPVSAYTLDGVGLEHYGIFVEEGRDALMRPPALKEQLSREISTIDGREYNSGLVSREAKRVTFKCCLKAADMFRLWSCRDAFFSVLVSPGWRELGYGGRAYECRYVSSQDFRLSAMRQNLVMVEFGLTLSLNREIVD